MIRNLFLPTDIGEVQGFIFTVRNDKLLPKWSPPKNLENCPLNYTLILNDETFPTMQTEWELDKPVPCKKYIGEIFANYLGDHGDNQLINYRVPPRSKI